MALDGRTQLLALAQSDPAIMAEIEAATSAEEITRVARDHGIELAASDLVGNAELTDSDLEGVSGGTMLHPTMSVFCGTNGSFCTFNPYACQSAG